MCSEKQMAYIAKLSNWKATPVDMAAVEEMDDSEASLLIDELKAKKSVRQAAPTTVTMKRIIPPDEMKAPERHPLAITTWNPVQAGMVKKEVARQQSAEWWADHPQQFAEACLGLYEAFEQADALMKRKYPEVAR